MASTQTHHPLPAPPGQPNSAYQQQPSHPQAPQHRRRFSNWSDKSGGKDGKLKISLLETHREKEAKRLHSKADPTKALSEVEPGVIAAQAHQTMENLRAMQHTDAAGNVITEPDQSNPTRWRFERPLDTIRGFENNIRKRDRSSMIPPGDNESVMSYNVRNSYYGNGNGNSTPGRYQHASYYSSSRPQSGAWDQQQQPQGRWGPPPERRRQNMNPEAQYGGAPRTPGGGSLYPSPGPANGDQRSYDTVASGSGSSGDRPGYVTDPTSSENSSINRRQSPQKRQQEPQEDYGIGFAPPAQYQPSTFAAGSNGGPQAGGVGPPTPSKAGSTLRKPVAEVQVMQEHEKQKKRKSWFGLKGRD